MKWSYLTASNNKQLAAYTTTFLTFGLGIFYSANVHAEPPDKQGSQWGLLGAAISQQLPYKGIDRSSMAFPFVYYENKYVRVFGPFMDIKLPSLEIDENNSIDYSITAQFDFGGYKKEDIKDTPILNGMKARRGGLWAGPKMEWHNEVVDVSAEFLLDLSGNSNGKRFNFGVEKNWRFGNHMMLTPRVVAKWQDEKYNTYFFGVRDEEVRFDRPSYKADGGFNIDFGIRGTYMFNKQHSMFLDLELTKLSKEIKDSPLVDASTQNFALFAYMYKF